MSIFFRKFTCMLRRILFAWLIACAALAATAGFALAEALASTALVVELAGNAWRLDPVNRVWKPLVQNQAIGQGDQLRTDALSRVTVHAGSSTLWLDAQTEVQVLQMNEVGFTLRLLTGDVALRVRDPQMARSTRIQTREGVVTQAMEGLARIGQGNRATRVGVLQGRAQFDSDPAAPLQRAWLREGEQAAFLWDDSARMERQSPSQDNFSAWFTYRDQVESGMNPRADVYYAPPEMARAVELQRYENRGSSVVEYGRVWIPTPVVRGWEPHRREVVPLPHHNPHPYPYPHTLPGVQLPRPNHAEPAQPKPNPIPAPRATTPAMQPVPAAPLAPRSGGSADEEKHRNPRHSKRDNLDRELRKPGIESQR
jgi:hypothetical protein